MTMTSEPAVQSPRHVETGGQRHLLSPRAAHDVLIELHEKSADGRGKVGQPVGLGFDPLDKVLGGGIRPGDLLLIGGAPGAGKTTFALQAAHNIAASGQATCLYLCYEHDEEYLITRLVSLESTGVKPGLSRESVGVGYSEVRGHVVSSTDNQGGLWQIFAGEPALIGALERIERYGPRLLLQRASGARTEAAAISDLVCDLRRSVQGPLVVVVDFLQKVPSFP